MTKFIYILKNKEWIDYYKYGFTTNLKKRVICCKDQHLYLSQYEKVYEIKENNYLLENIYFEYDKIISKMSRSNNKINFLKDKYNIELTNLVEIKDYLIYNNSGEEFIKKKWFRNYR